MNTALAPRNTDLIYYKAFDVTTGGTILVGQLFQFLARSLVHFASNHFPIMALPSDAVNEEMTADGQFVTKWGSSGTADGQFNGPMGLTVDPSGYVYVVDIGNKRVQVFAPSNQTSKSINSKLL